MTREERRERVARAIDPIAWAPEGFHSNGHAWRRENSLVAADEAMTALDALMVEEGMVWVPKEPTEKMIAAGESVDYGYGDGNADCEMHWSAMISAWKKETDSR